MEQQVASDYAGNTGKRGVPGRIGSTTRLLLKNKENRHVEWP